jgi:hypothetical protein
MPKSPSVVARKVQPSRRPSAKWQTRHSLMGTRVPMKPSPTIVETATTEADMLSWVGWFARFHSDPPPYIPYALRTFDCLVEVRRSQPDDDKPPQLMRCVHEVAKRQLPESVEWHLITWAIGLPGAQFERCSSLEDAMQRFSTLPSSVQF